MTDQTMPAFVAPRPVTDPAAALPEMDARLAELRDQRDRSPLGRARAAASTRDVVDARTLTRAIRAATDGMTETLAGLVADLPAEDAARLGDAARRIVAAVEDATRGARS